MTQEEVMEQNTRTCERCGEYGSPLGAYEDKDRMILIEVLPKEEK